MYIIMFVLDDPQKLDAVLEAWEQAGITGVTIIDSTGFQRHKKQNKRIPMRFAFQPVVLEGEEGNLTLFTIVREKKLVDNAILAAESIVGNLDDPNTGVLAAWPLSHVKGLPPLPGEEDGEENI